MCSTLEILSFFDGFRALVALGSCGDDSFPWVEDFFLARFEDSYRSIEETRCSNKSSACCLRPDMPDFHSDVEENVLLADKETMISSLFVSELTFTTAPCSSRNFSCPTTPSMGLCSSSNERTDEIVSIDAGRQTDFYSLNFHDYVNSTYQRAQAISIQPAQP